MDQFYWASAERVPDAKGWLKAVFIAIDNEVPNILLGIQELEENGAVLFRTIPWNMLGAVSVFLRFYLDFIIFVLNALNAAPAVRTNRLLRR